MIAGPQMSSDFLDFTTADLPFISWFPASHEISDVSIRQPSEKWATVRYFVYVNGIRIRVKEFFMDWFFPGFPKSLMNSLFSVYSPLDAIADKERLLFIGKNYRGRYASSTYIAGTTVEMESQEGNADREMTAVFRDLVCDPEDARNKCGMSFEERSYFAKGRSGSWFEDQRINRLKWNSPSISEGKFVGDYSLSSVGHLTVHNSVKQVIAVFQKDCFGSGFWVEVVAKDAGISHAYYSMRQEPGLMDMFADEGFFLSWRKPHGPYLGQAKTQDDAVVTVGASPFADMSLIRDILSGGNTLDRLSEMSTEIHSLLAH